MARERRGVADGLAAASAGWLVTADQERWAEALQIEKMHGEGAPAYVAAQLGGLALAGDEAGVARFLEIATRLDQLRGRGRPT